MKNILFVLLAGALLCGCSSTPITQAPEPTMTETVPPTPTWTSTSEPTNTMTPTATVTLVPLSEINWNTVIYQSGDLPEMFMETEMAGSSDYHGIGDQIDFRIPGTDDGIKVTLGIYESAEAAREAYQELITALEPTTGFGEQASSTTDIISDDMFGTILKADLAFFRCHAVVYMTMVTFDWSDQPWSDPAIIAEYAGKLDARLSEVACR